MFTQKTPLSIMAWADELRWWTQTSSVGRSVSADTDDIAETVTPNRPAGPSVVTTLTVLAAAAIPDTKRSRRVESVCGGTAPAILPPSAGADALSAR
jgi:hypothetical protein